jgi:hypothetical protein
MAGRPTDRENSWQRTPTASAFCGNIFGRYLAGLSRYPELRVTRVGDVDTARAKEAAAEYDVPAWGDDGDLYADDSVDIVVNKPGTAAGPRGAHVLLNSRVTRVGHAGRGCWTRGSIGHEEAVPWLRRPPPSPGINSAENRSRPFYVSTCRERVIDNGEADW